MNFNYAQNINKVQKLIKYFIKNEKYYVFFRNKHGKNI